MYVYVSVCMYIYIYLYVYRYIYIYIYIYVYVYVCVYIYIYMCIYVYIYPALPVSVHSAPNERSWPNERRSPPNGRRQNTNSVRERMRSSPNEPDSRRMNVVLLSDSGSFGEPTFQRSRFIRLPNVAEWTYSRPDERILGRMNVF